jgi:hypothetical protein
MLKFLALFGVVALCSGSVLMEVSFDLALQQESETGYTASHTVEEYLKDSNLLWLRYLNTLVSGSHGAAPMRTAMMEFTDYAGWTKFESTNMERTHILYDLFWINWKRVLWEDNAALTVKAKERSEESPGGYMYLFRYAFKDGKAKEGSHFIESKLKGIDMKSNDGFLERRGFTNGLWQDEYTNLMWVEFSSMESLSKSVYEDAAFVDALKEAKEKYFSKYATSIMVPSAGSQGGQFFQGGASEK